MYTRKKNLPKNKPPIFAGKDTSLLLNEVLEDSFIHWM